MPTDHEQAFGAQILKKCFHAKISETFHPLPVGTHCALEGRSKHYCPLEDSGRFDKCETMLTPCALRASGLHHFRFTLFRGRHQNGNDGEELDGMAARLVRTAMPAKRY